MPHFPVFSPRDPGTDKIDSDRDEQIKQSFPASDPPSTTPQRALRRGEPYRTVESVAGNIREFLRGWS